MLLRRRLDLVILVGAVFAVTVAVPMQHVEFVDVQEEERGGFEVEVRLLFAELFNGITAAEFPAGTRTTAVTVRLPEDELTAEFLDTTLMRSPAGEWVPLGEIVTACDESDRYPVRVTSPVFYDPDNQKLRN